MSTTSAAWAACSTHNIIAAVNCSRCPTGVISPTKAMPPVAPPPPGVIVSQPRAAGLHLLSTTVQPTVVGGPMCDWPTSASTRATGRLCANRFANAINRVVLPVSAAPSSRNLPFGGGLVPAIRSAIASAQFSDIHGRPSHGSYCHLSFSPFQHGIEEFARGKLGFGGCATRSWQSRHEAVDGKDRESGMLISLPLQVFRRPAG